MRLKNWTQLFRQFILYTSNVDERAKEYASDSNGDAQAYTLNITELNISP